MNGKKERIECQRCGKVFYATLDDSSIVDRLCSSCWLILEFPVVYEPDPDTPLTPQWEAEHREIVRQNGGFATVEDCISAMDSLN